MSIIEPCQIIRKTVPDRNTERVNDESKFKFHISFDDTNAVNANENLCCEVLADPLVVRDHHWHRVIPQGKPAK